MDIVSHRARVLTNKDKPPPLVVNVESIPEFLTTQNRFVGWRWHWKKTKWDKPPLRLTGRGAASSTDPSTWGTFSQAVEAYERHGMGMGFALDDSGVTCLDLDGCRNPETGVFEAWALAIIERAQTYGEVSPSGTGAKLFFRGKLPEWANHKYERPDGSQLETWDSGRYVALTGDRLPGTPDDVVEGQAVLEAILRDAAEWNKPKTEAASVVTVETQSAEPDDRQTALAALSVLNASCSYPDWLNIGMALHSVDSSDAMLTEWDRWSRESEKYVTDEPAKKWKKFDSGGGVTLGTLCHLADATGQHWRPMKPQPNASHQHQQKPATPAKTRPSVDAFQPFPLRLLPQPVRGFVITAARSIGCEPATMALTMIVACAAAIGNSRTIRLKGGWSEPAVIWGAIVARSGDRKSPAIELTLRALRERQRRALKEFEEAHRQWNDVALAKYDSDLSEWKKRKGPDKGSPPTRPQEPIPWRIIVDDVTIEALALLLHHQHRGLLMGCDELSGWLGSFQRYKSGGGSSDVPKWLEAHGARMLLVDRKTGQPRTVVIPRAAVSVAGTIQPEILQRCLTPEHRANGLAARLLVTMPPRRPRQWSEHELSESAQKTIDTLFDRLLSLEMLPPEQINDDPRPRALSITAEAKALFVQFVNEHGMEQADLDGDLAATWSKLEGYAARFALVHQLIRWANGDCDGESIDAESMSAGIDLARWFGLEARRVHATFAETDEEREQRELIDWIRRRGGRTSVREMMSRRWRCRSSAEAVRQELQVLVKAGVGLWEQVATEGRSREDFVLIGEQHQRIPDDSLESDTSADADADTPIEIGARYLPPDELSTLVKWE